MNTKEELLTFEATLHTGATWETLIPISQEEEALEYYENLYYVGRIAGFKVNGIEWEEEF